MRKKTPNSLPTTEFTYNDTEKIFFATYFRKIL